MGIDVERRLLRFPFAHSWRTAWSRLQRPAAERWLGRFDVLHFSDWMYPPQRDGVRATTIHDLVPLRFPEWTHGRTVRMHGAKYRHAARTTDLIMCNSHFTARDVRDLLHVPAERIHVAHPAPAPVFAAHGERADARAAVRAHGRHARAAQEPGDAARCARAARRRARRSRSSELPVGDRSRVSTGRAWRGSATSTTTELSRLYRGASVFAYPSRFEGFGIPVARGNGERRASRRVRARLDRRRVRRRRRACRPRERRGARVGDPGGARTPGRARGSGSRNTFRGSRRAAWARPFSPRTRKRLRDSEDMRVGIDISPLRQTRAGTARYLREILPHLAAARRRRAP